MPTFCRKLQVASFYSSLKQPYTKFIIMLSHSSRRILKISNKKLLVEANAYILPQTAGR